MDNEPKTQSAAESPAASYAIARLALWAGDLEYADRLLKECLGDARRISRSIKIDFYEDPIAFTARRLRNQLSRRRSECRRLLKASALPSATLAEFPKVLISESSTLRGAIWPRDEDRVSMFAFLTSASEEIHQEFFARAARLSQTEIPNEIVANYFATDDQSAIEVSEQNKNPVGFAPTWSVEGDLFLRVHVGDYGTVEAHGVWTKRQSPQENDVLRPLQSILDSLDPLVAPNQNFLS